SYYSTRTTSPAKSPDTCPKGFSSQPTREPQRRFPAYSPCNLFGRRSSYCFSSAVEATKSRTTNSFTGQNLPKTGDPGAEPRQPTGSQRTCWSPSSHDRTCDAGSRTKNCPNHIRYGFPKSFSLGDLLVYEA